MSNLYCLRCVDCGEVWYQDVTRHGDLLNRIWIERKKFVELRRSFKSLDVIPIGDGVRVGGVLELYSHGFDFLEKHDLHHVVLKEECGAEKEIQAEVPAP